MAIVSTQWNIFNYYNVTLKIIFNINQFFAHMDMVTIIVI